MNKAFVFFMLYFRVHALSSSDKRKAFLLHVNQVQSCGSILSCLCISKSLESLISLLCTQASDCCHGNHGCLVFRWFRLLVYSADWWELAIAIAQASFNMTYLLSGISADIGHAKPAY